MGVEVDKAILAGAANRHGQARKHQDPIPSIVAWFMSLPLPVLSRVLEDVMQPPMKTRMVDLLADRMVEKANRIDALKRVGKRYSKRQQADVQASMVALGNYERQLRAAI